MSNSHKNSQFYLSVGAVNIDGCMTGSSVGGGKDGGGLLQWGSLNMTCFMNALGDGERHVDVRARTKCWGVRDFRWAMTYDQPKDMSKIERTEACVKYVVPIWKSEINYLRELAVQQTETEYDTVGGEEPGK